MLGVGLAVMTVGALAGVAYLFSRVQYRTDSGTPPAGPNIQKPDDQIVPAPAGADLTDPQQGASNMGAAEKAATEAAADLPPARRRNPNLDDADQGAGVDYVSENDVDGVAGLLAMMTGYVDEENPDYQGPYVE